MGCAFRWIALLAGLDLNDEGAIASKSNPKDIASSKQGCPAYAPHFSRGETLYVLHITTTMIFVVPGVMLPTLRKRSNLPNVCQGRCPLLLHTHF